MIDFIDLPLKMESIQCSETSAVSTQTPGKHPKENIFHLPHGESLKSRKWFMFIFNYALQPSRLIVRSGLDVPTFATRRLHACHYARAPSGGRWNCGREMSGNFA
jgi:hypothetical protein